MRSSGKSLTRTTYEWPKRRSPGDDAFAPDVVLEERQFEQLLPAFAESGVGLGNTPYTELKLEASQIHIEVDGCLRLKPNQRKSMRWLRTILFEPFSQVVAFHDRDRDLLPEVATFLGRYADRSVHVDTNEDGERVTTPASDADEVVSIAGDSVAFGAGVGNEVTLASQMQRRDMGLRYVNLGVGGARSADILCNLAAATNRYSGKIRRLIYVYCENDLEEYRA